MVLSDQVIKGVSEKKLTEFARAFVKKQEDAEAAANAPAEEAD